jgi:hypothetical protein
MRSLKHRELAFLLVGSLAAATPAFAKDGSDDGSNSSSGNSSSSTSGTAGTSGTSSTSCNVSHNSSSGSSSSSGSKCGFTTFKTLPVKNVSFKKSSGQKGKIQTLELKMKIGKNGLITQSNFDNDVGTLSAIFPGNIVCEMVGVNQSSNAYTYLVRAKAWKGVTNVRVGTCESRATLPATPLNRMPVLRRGNVINFMYDADGDANTTDDIVDVGRIRLR